LTTARRATGFGALAALSAVAFLWGVAEAIYFFVVADVLLTFIAVAYGLRTGLLAGLAAALGAACGGMVMARWAATDPDQAMALLRSVPFVSEAMIGKGLAGMTAADWPFAMLRGSVTGIPYKVYAVGAGREGIDALLFAAVSIPVRLLRYVVGAAVVAGLSTWLRPRLSLRGRMMLMATFWMVFYGEFWLRWSS
jgi:hypothetical protein